MHGKIARRKRSALPSKVVAPFGNKKQNQGKGQAGREGDELYGSTAQPWWQG